MADQNSENICELSERRKLKAKPAKIKKDGDDTTGISKLVMKNISQGKRKKALVHSIPKFSQVLPNQQLVDVQKLLQKRLLEKKEMPDKKHDSVDNDITPSILHAMVNIHLHCNQIPTKSIHSNTETL